MEVPDYNHLTVAAANSVPPAPPVTSGAKVLVRNNSVATLNQIYQHQNSIPARNRILNTTKSLQQPSIDLPSEGPNLEQVEQQNLSEGLHPSRYQQQAYPSSHYSVSNQVDREENSKETTSQQSQPFLIAWSSRVRAGAGNQSGARHQLAAGQINNINISDLSKPVQIINVARRHKRAGHLAKQQQANSSAAAASGGRPNSAENRKWRASSRNSPACYSSGDSSSSCSSLSAGLEVSPKASSPRVSSVQPTAASSSWGRNSNLEVIQPATSGGASGTRGVSRSPSPARQQTIQQLSAETSPTNYPQPAGSGGRRRMLPQEPQLRPQEAAEQNQRFKQQQVISQPSDEAPQGERGAVKKGRKLPQIPTQFQQPAPDLTASGNREGRLAPMRPPVIAARSNKSSLSSSSSSSNSPLVAPIRAPVSRSNSRASQQQQQPAFVQSFQPPANMILLDQQPLPAQIEQLAVKFGQQTSSESNSLATESFHSPRTPLGPRPTGSYAGQQHRKLPAPASPRAPTNGWYFTFEQGSNSLEQQQQEANFVCYSPGGSRFLGAGEPNQMRAASSQQLEVSGEGLAGQNQLALEQQTSAGRGRRLSSCGSGLRANFLMNKQHAISEFTPPRSLESSTSRGSADWPQLQPSSDTCLPNQIGGRKGPAGPLRTGSGDRGCGEQLSAAASELTSMNFRSSSAQNIIQRNSSFGQASSSDRNYSLAGAPVHPSTTTTAGGAVELPEPRLIGYSLAGPTSGPNLSIGPLAGRRRSQVAGGLPPRAASATESTSTGQLPAEACELSAIQQARSMSAVPAVALRPQQPQQQGAPHPADRMWLSPGGSRGPEGLASSAGYLRPRLGSSAMLTATAISIDVYHCEPTGRSSFEGYTNRPPSTGLQVAELANKSPMGSQLIPVQRDRQPSNVSTNSMPAVSNFRTNSLSPGASGQLSTSGGGRPEPQRQTSAQSPNQNQATSTRKFGAWVEILGSSPARWKRSAGQLGAGQQQQQKSSSLSKSFSPSSSSSSSSSPGRGNQRDDDDSSTSSELSRTSLPSSSLAGSSSGLLAEACDKCPRRKTSGNQHEEERQHLSSGADSLSSWSSSSGSRYGGASSRPRTARRRRARRHQSRLQAPNRRGRPKGGSNQAHDPSRVASGGEQISAAGSPAGYADQLTLCDKLKLAERSASKLFPKVDLSSSSPHHQTAGELPDRARAASQLPAAEASGRASSGRAPPSTGVDHHRHNQQQANEPARGTNKANKSACEDDNGDDLSLLLRSAERELQEERLRRPEAAASKPATVQPNHDNNNRPDLNLKRGWLRSLSKRHQAEPETRELPQPAGSVRKTASKAARVVRRAMTLKSLVRTLRTNSTGEPVSSPTANSSPSRHHLLSVSGTGESRGRMRSADEFFLPSADRPEASTAARNSCSSGGSGRRRAGSNAAAESLSSRAVTKLRAAILFRKAKQSSSINTSSELDMNHPPSRAETHSELTATANNNRRPPLTPTSFRPQNKAPVQSGDGPTACFDPTSCHQNEQSTARAKRGLNKMKSVITAVSATLEPLKAMGHLRQQSMQSSSGVGNSPERTGGGGGGGPGQVGPNNN